MSKHPFQPEATPTYQARARIVARRWCVVLCGVCLVSAGCAATATQAPSPAEAAAAAAAAPPPYSGPTLPKLLGVQDCAKVAAKCAQKACTCLKQQFPGPGAAAPNLGEVGPQSSPAAKCAAEIIAADAKAPQTIDAIRYLGRVGCTKCYPCVEEGLVAALDDCHESVRFEAAKAIRATASEQCKCCQCTSCCTQKIYEKLYKVAYDTRSDGCPVECSSRVRRVARQALCLCGGPMVSEEEVEPTPAEGPSGAAAAPAAPSAKSAEPAAAPAAGAGAAAAPPPVNAGAATTPKPPENKQSATAPVEPKAPKDAVTTDDKQVSSTAEPPPNPLRLPMSAALAGPRSSLGGLSMDRPANPFRPRAKAAPSSSSGPPAHLTTDVKKASLVRVAAH